MTDPWYTAPDSPELADHPAVTGLNVTGRGEPGGSSYVDACGALYSLAAPNASALEGRWWVEDDRPPLEVPRQYWHWHLFLRLPDDLDPAWLGEARARALGAGAPPAVNRVTLTTWPAATYVQVMHHGSFADEPRTLAAMERFMRAAGVVPTGLHHEIYLTDPQRTPPEHARTILRQPVV